MNLDKIETSIKTGKELLHSNGKPLKSSLEDFWRWSVSDLLSNATRGRFAEFIVATATGIDMTVLRDEWAAFDLETNEGIKLEVKSAAFLQSWQQQSLSKITFTTKSALSWDNLTNKRSSQKKRHADVYVFCLLKHKDKQTVDPLNMDQWEFYVLATKELNDYERSQQSITLKSLQTLTNFVSYSELHEAIIEKNLLNDN